MKETLYEHLHSWGMYDYKKTDAMAKSFCHYWKKNNLLPNRLERSALYHFFIMTMYYIAEYCTEEDFVPESFFKLLYTEVKDENFQSDQFYTTFDIIVNDQKEDDQNLFYLYESFDSLIENVPDPDKMYKLYMQAFEYYIYIKGNFSKSYNYMKKIKAGKSYRKYVIDSYNCAWMALEVLKHGNISNTVYKKLDSMQWKYVWSNRKNTYQKQPKTLIPSIVLKYLKTVFKVSEKRVRGVWT